MKVAVTGASGHLGNVICRLLLEQGHQVKGLVFQDKRSLQDVAIQRISGSLFDRQALLNLLKDCEVLIHSAALISIHEDPLGKVLETNITGTRNIIESCAQVGLKRLVYISSTHAVKALPLDEEFTEARPYKTKSDFPYDYSKAECEKLVLQAKEQYNLEVLVLRPSSIVGPFDFKPSELGKALLDLLDRKIPALPEGGHNFVDVRDVAQTAIQSLTQGVSGEIYLTTGKYYSLKELGQLVEKTTSVKTPRLMLPFWLMTLLLPLVKIYGKLKGSAPLFTKASLVALKEGHPYMDASKARKDLNHQSRPLEESIVDFYAWQTQRKSHES